MPLYFNVKPHVVRVILNDGRSFGFPPRQEIHLLSEDISGEVQGLIDSKILVYRGHTSKDEQINDKPLIKEENVTYSDLQQEYDNRIDKEDEATSLDEGNDSDESFLKRRRKKRNLGE